MDNDSKKSGVTSRSERDLFAIIERLGISEREWNEKYKIEAAARDSSESKEEPTLRGDELLRRASARNSEAKNSGSKHSR